MIVAPLLNVYSFEMMTPHVNPIDRKSMNGLYPGDANGTQTQRALAAVTEQIVTPADVVVDLHGGDLDEDLRPYSYWFRGGRAAQDSAGLRLALAFGLDHIIVTDMDPSSPTAGRSLSGQALVRGRRCSWPSWPQRNRRRRGFSVSVDGSLDVLAALKMLDRRVTPVKHVTWLAGAGSRVLADSAGVFFPLVARDVRVTKGQVLGRTTDFLGRPTGEIHAPIDGLVTFIRGVPSMAARATLVNIAPVLPNSGTWKAPK